MSTVDHNILSCIMDVHLLHTRTGPGRSELKRMEQYINQAEDPAMSSSSNQPQSSSPPSSSSSSQPFGMGIMRMPGRGGRRSDPRLIPGVGDETIEASLLGDLAVLSISNDSHEVQYYNTHTCTCTWVQYSIM